MKIFIAGHYGFQNLGDELLLLKIINDLLKVEPSHIYIWTSDSIFTESFLKKFCTGISFTCVKRFSVEETIEAIADSDVIVLGGGGLINEHYDVDIRHLFSAFGYGIVSYAIPPFLGKVYGKKVFYWALGHGPVMSKSGRSFSRWFYSLADVITVRDEYSYHEVKELVPESEIYLDTDPLFYLGEIPAFEFLKKREIPARQIITINLRKWFYDDDVESIYMSLIEEVFKYNSDVFIQLLPFDLSNDIELLQRIARKINDKRVQVVDTTDPHDVVRHLSISSRFMGMRLHSIIISASIGIPTFALAYDIKVEEICRRHQIPYISIQDLKKVSIPMIVGKLFQIDNAVKIIPYKTPEIFTHFVSRLSETSTTHILEHEVIKENHSLFQSDLMENYQSLKGHYKEKFIEELLTRRRSSEYKVIQLKNQISEIKVRLEEALQENRVLTDKINKLKLERDELKNRLEEILHENKVLTDEIKNLTDKIKKLESERDDLTRRLNEIYTGNFWKVASTYYKIRDKTPLRYIYKLIVRNKGKIQPQQAETQAINPYEFLDPFCPISVKVIRKRYRVGGSLNFPKFSLIIPLKDEEKGLKKFLTLIENQSLQPDEIIFVDGGSEDNTIYILNDFAQRARAKGLNVHIHQEPGGLAKQRNLGLRTARNEYVLFLDMLENFEQDLFINIIGVLQDFPEADLVCGIYVGSKRSSYESYFVWNWKKVDFERFIPSAKVLLVKRELALRVGGFPEFLPYTGEDTLFAINYRKISGLWVINLEAVVEWEVPVTFEEATRKAYLYGKGDGENGFGEFRFYETMCKYFQTGAIDLNDEIVKEAFKGFLEGRKRRIGLLKRAGQLAGNFLILSCVPFTDSGGGQRGTQLGLELMRRNFKVTFCSVFPSYEEKKKIFLDVSLPHLELWSFGDFRLDDYLERHAEILDKTVVLVEFPYPEFVNTVKELKGISPSIRVIYDCIDNWESSLGWIWYNREKELEVLELADYVIASARTLKERLTRMTDKPVYFIPNAVNQTLFKRDVWRKPVDLPEDKPVVIYVGALWGEWFDWTLVERLAREIENAYIVLIGNVTESIKEKYRNLSNLIFLGLKPQYEIPLYLKFAKVCIIPFKYDEKIIKYTNPLKVYEYLASGKPVVSGYMDEVVGLPCVHVARDHDEFIMLVKLQIERNAECNEEIIRKVLEEHSWAKRVDELLSIIDLQ